MRAERALFLLKPGHAEPLVKHLVKLCQFIRWLNSGPQIFWRVRSAEAAQAANRKIKSFNWQVSGGITYIRQPLSGHTTEKYQCKMQLIRSLPARPSDRLLDRHQTPFHRIGDFQSEEQTTCFWFIQPAPQTILETGADNTALSCHKHHARPSPTTNCPSVHKLPPTPLPAPSPIESR